VFCNSVKLAQLRAALAAEIDPQKDSLRFYFLGKHWQNRLEQVGAKASYDPEGLLLI
jgi:CRISPR-associated protein Cas2